jgi:hypothetical protein
MSNRIHLVPNPSRELPEYSELLNALLEAWQPDTLTERQFVTDMAEAKFGMWRMAALEVHLWNQAIQSTTGTGAGVELDAIGRAASRYERRYQRALSQLLRLAATSRPAPQPPSAPGAYGQSRRAPLAIVARGRSKNNSREKLPKAA